MRSALWQAIDIIGADASSEDLVVLWIVISDLVYARLPKAWDDPAWETANGLERVRMILGPGAIDGVYLVDWTEPEPVLRRLGLIRPASPEGSADDR